MSGGGVDVPDQYPGDNRDGHEPGPHTEPMDPEALAEYLPYIGVRSIEAWKARYVGIQVARFNVYMDRDSGIIYLGDAGGTWVDTRYRALAGR